VATTANEQVEVDPETGEIIEPEPEDDDELEDDDEFEDVVEPDESQPVEPESTLSEKEAEKRLDRIGKRAVTWRNSVSEVLGEIAQDLTPCPRCLPFAPGFIFPFEVAPPPEDVVAAVRASLGEKSVPEYLMRPEARECPGCAGWGSQRTGSKVGTEATIKCQTCGGRGWVGPGSNQPSHDAAAVAASGGEGYAEASEPAPTRDPWGRPVGHDKFGVMPSYDPTYNATDFPPG
jgi:hypothetical protein